MPDLRQASTETAESERERLRQKLLRLIVKSETRRRQCSRHAPRDEASRGS